VLHRGVARRLVLKSRWARLALALLAGCLLWLGIEAWQISSSVAPFVSARASDLPSTHVALVLGCSPQLSDGRRNLFFDRRISAAAELLRAGKVRYLLVSGDNSRPGYDEPTSMRAALIAAGVPPTSIVRDYAGFRTLDSVVRAKQVFGLHEMLIVSQRFHNERAVYLARAHGIQAWGYDAPAVGGPEGLRVALREVLSRLTAVLDIKLLHSTPHFSGPPEPTAFP
jgi:SanA protein